MRPFGTLPDGRTVRAWTIARGDLAATVLDYGARLVSYARGDGPNVCVSGDRLEDYLGRLRFAGPVIAPVINRIGGALAVIDGETCRFEANQDGRHTLHSGTAGTQNTLWDVTRHTATTLTLAATLPHEAGGFPGHRTVTATYDLTDALTLRLTATTDRPTLMNPGLHGVWNPDGNGTTDGLRLTVPARTFLPVDADTLPLGQTAPVAGTPYDHRHAAPAAATLDHNFCFDARFGLRARLEGTTGRALEIHSDAPGLQAYAGGREGIALEPQLWPDAPNHPDFPPILMTPDRNFRQSTRISILA